jgi:hypothetical protein
VDDAPDPRTTISIGALLPIAASVVLLAGALAISLKILPYQIDDAAIFHRYAFNLAGGHGLRFNVADPAPVEGYSSPLWLAMLALAARLGLRDALTAVTVVVGLACALGVSWVLTRPAPGDDSRRARWGGVVSLALFALTPPATFHAVAGLETLAFALLVALVLRADRFPRAAIVAAALSSWTRPEGPVVLATIVTQHLAERLGRRDGAPPSARTPARALLAGVLGTAALFVARRLYFHAWLPNPYYAKPAILLEGLDYVALGLAQPWAKVIAAFALLGAILGRARHRGYFVASLLWLAAVVFEGGDWMPAGRMLAPALIAASLAASGVVESRLFARPRVAPWAAGAIAIGVTFGVVQAARASWFLAKTAEVSHDSLDVEANLLADWAQRSGARSIAVVDVGAPAQRTTLEIVDLGGLTDATIGHASGPLLAKRFDVSYVIDQRQPDLVVLRVFQPPPRDAAGHLAITGAMIASDVEQRVFEDPRFAARYRLLFMLVPAQRREPFYGRVVYARQGFEVAKAAAFANDIVVAH